MTDEPLIEPDPAEAERGRDALRELRVEPLPADVLARLDGRLEGELGRPAPVRRRRQRTRLAFAIPGAAVALGVAVVVAVLATDGDGTRPAQRQSAFSVQAKAAPPAASTKARAGVSGGSAADSSASAEQAPATVRVPALVGHGLGYLRSVTAARGLTWGELPGATCPRVPSVTVKRQLPRAGTMVRKGATIRVSFGACERYDAGS